MKTKRYKIVYLIIAVLVAVFTVGCAFAWLAEDRREQEAGFGGSSGSAYFAGGSGLTADDPYLITDKYHMYNLAWLQNTGRFVNDQGNPEKYYFKLGADVDMGDIWLPPIGTDSEPFRGNFDGNGKTISGLKVTTDKAKLTSAPQSAGAFSNSVGMFGVTEKDSEVHNFVLDDPIVEVAVDNAPYSPNGEKVAGLAVGLVGGKAYSVGVLAEENASGGTQLLIQRVGYSTFNSIIGGLASGVTSSVTGGGHGTGGSGSSFGANFDISMLLDRLGKIHSNDGASFLLPSVESTNVLAAGEKIAFTVTDKSTYDGSTAAEEVASNNVGYFTGNQNKIQTKSLVFRERLVEGNNNLWTFSDGSLPEAEKAFPNWFYTFGVRGADNKLTYSDYNYAKEGECGGFRALSEEEYADLPDSIKSLLAVDESNYPLTLSESHKITKANNNTVRMQAPYKGATAIELAGSASTTDNNVAWAFHGQISWMGKTYGEGFRNSNGYAVDSEGNYLDRNGNVVSNQSAPYNEMLKGVPLPNNAIWFKPAHAGKIRLVMYSETTQDAFSLVKCVRDYASEDDPFALEKAAKVDSGGWGAKYASAECVFMHQLPARVLFYYEYEITSKDLVNGTYPEFMVCNGNTDKNGAYFVYLDLGASATDDVSTVQKDKDVSAIDFIYSDVSIKQTKADGDTIDIGNFIVSADVAYEATMTSIYFEKLETTLKIVYVRKAVTPDVADDARISATVTGFTGTNPVKATVTTYAEIKP